MKKITLIMPHEMNGVVHQEGETIEVSDDVYDYLQQAYRYLREAPIREAQQREAEERLEKMVKKYGRGKQ